MNLEGRVQEAHRAITPAEELVTTEETLNALADKLGFSLKDTWTKELHQRVAPSIAEH